MDEHRLLDGVAAGDSSATEVFVRRYEGDVQGWVRRAGVPAADAADVCQDVLFGAIRQLSSGRFERRSKVGTWLWRIARRKALTYRRDRGRRALGRSVPLDITQPGAPDFSTPAAQETRLLLEGVLASLPPRHRVVLAAYVRGNMDVPALSALLGIGEKRVQNLLADAKRLFRQHVCERGNLTDPRRLMDHGHEQS